MTNETEWPALDPSLSWEDQLAELLAMLSGIQGELLQVLQRKRELLLASDQEGLAEIAPQEQQLIDRLQHCHQQREGLLKRASEQGLPSRDLQTLHKALPGERPQVRAQLREARTRSRLLQHQSLTNWVLVQRTLIHLSQILEIIATGGQPEPTYGKSGPRAASGSFVDHAA